MTEVAFAKTFLTTLDSKPAKYQANHVFDPEKFGLRYPYVLPKLSHPPHPEPPKSSDASKAPPGAEPAAASNTLTVVLKSTRNPNMTLTLSGTPPSTTLLSLKDQIQAYLGGAAVVKTEKIKILQNKKPVPASKITLADVVEDVQNAKEVELGVMIMGGAPDPAPQGTTAVTTKAPEPAGPGSENATVEAATGQNPEESATEVPPVPMEGVETGSKTETAQPLADSGMEVLKSPEFWDDLEGFLAQRVRDQETATRLRKTFESAWNSNTANP